MNSSQFNHKQIEAGFLTDGMIAKMVEADKSLDGIVRSWQRSHNLTADGKAGEKTRRSISLALGEPVIVAPGLVKCYPLRCLEDGRKPIITSKFRDENSDRSTHDGVDFFFKWLNSDPDVFSGHGGAIKKGGKRRWWYPDGRVAVACADGVILDARHTKTGYKVWLDMGNGQRAGYFHGAQLLVETGQVVLAGHPVIVVGDNPNGGYKKHLHFEISSSIDVYRPINPRLWLDGAKYLTA